MKADDGARRLVLGTDKPHIYRAKGRWHCFHVMDGQYRCASCAAGHAGIENSPGRAYFLLGQGYYEVQP